MNDDVDYQRHGSLRELMYLEDESGKSAMRAALQATCRPELWRTHHSLVERRTAEPVLA